MKFVKDNKVYIILLLFIILFNILGKTFPVKKEEYKISADIGNIFFNKEDIIQIIKENRNLNLSINILVLFLVVLTLIGFGILIWYIFTKKNRNELFSKTYTVVDINWGIWDVIKLGILFIFIAYILNIFNSIFFNITDISSEFKKFAPVFSTSIVDILLFFILVYFVKWKVKNKLTTLGLTFKNFSKNIIVGISGYAASIPILICIFVCSVFISNLLKYYPPPEPIFIFFVTTKNINFIIYSIILVCIIGPIVEETFFRGFTYNAIKKKVGVKWAVIISALIFSLLHINLVGFLPIFFLGILLAYLYQKTGSLIPSIATHILHNSIMVSLVLIIRKIITLKLNP